MRRVLGGALLLTFVLLLGCGQKPATNAEYAAAREAVQTGLDAWKNGESAAKLESGSVPLVFTDPDWKAGTKLTDFQITKVYGEPNGTATCAANLKMQIRGKAKEKDATYLVTLKPKRVVVRED